MANTTTALDPVRRTLQEVDSYTQHHNERMSTLIRAAKALLLSRETTALMDVHELLDVMWCHCNDLENTVNSEAENHGCHYVDERRRALKDKFDALANHGGDHG